MRRPGGEIAIYREGAFQGDVVLLNGRNSVVRNSSLAVLEDRCDINGFPLDRSLVTWETGEFVVAVGPKLGTSTFAAAKICFTLREISGPIPSPSMKVTV